MDPGTSQVAPDDLPPHLSPQDRRASLAPSSRRISTASSKSDTRQLSPSARFLLSDTADQDKNGSHRRTLSRSPVKPASLRFASPPHGLSPNSTKVYSTNATASGSGVGLLSDPERSAVASSNKQYDQDTAQPMDVDQESLNTIEDSSDEEERGVITIPDDQEGGSSTDSSDGEGEEGQAVDEDGQENIDDITLNIDGVGASGMEDDQDEGNEEEGEEEDDGDDEDDEDDEEDDDEDDNGSVDLNSDRGDTPVFVSSTLALLTDGSLPEIIEIKTESNSQQTLVGLSGDASHDLSQHINDLGDMESQRTTAQHDDNPTQSSSQNQTTIPDPAGNTQPIPAQTEDGQPINTLQPKKRPKRIRQASPTPEPIVPPPLVDMQTVRLEFSLNSPVLPKDQARMFNFKNDAVTQGAVEKDYWQLLLGIRPMADDEKQLEDDKMQGEETGESSVTAKAQPSAPSGGLAALMAASGDGPEDMTAMAKLAAQYDKSYEAANPSKRKPKKKKEKNVYDVLDAFVDDSELIIDEPDFYHQPKRAGFYVADGDVELCGEVEDE